MDTLPTESGKIKSFYKLGGSPNERIILRRIVEVNGGRMLHNFSTGTTVVETPTASANRDVYRRFYKIQSQMARSRAIAEAVINLPVKTVRSEFSRVYADTISARILATIPLDPTKGVKPKTERIKLYRLAYKAAMECEIL